MPDEGDAVKRLEARVVRLEHIVTGNGEQGLDEVVRTNSRTLERIGLTLERSFEEFRKDLRGLGEDISRVDGKVDALQDDRKLDAAAAEGRSRAFKQMRAFIIAGAAVLSLLGSLGLITVNSRVGEVQQQLQSIPSLPE